MFENIIWAAVIAVSLFGAYHIGCKSGEYKAVKRVNEEFMSTVERKK